MIYKQKIFDILSNEDFEYLIIETDSCTNHITKIKTPDALVKFTWLMQTRDTNMQQAYVQADSLANELCAVIKGRDDTITKISALIVMNPESIC